MSKLHFITNPICCLSVIYSGFSPLCPAQQYSALCLLFLEPGSAGSLRTAHPRGSPHHQQSRSQSTKLIKFIKGQRRLKRIKFQHIETL